MSPPFIKDYNAMQKYNMLNNLLEHLFMIYIHRLLRALFLWFQELSFLYNVYLTYSFKLYVIARYQRRKRVYPALWHDQTINSGKNWMVQNCIKVLYFIKITLILIHVDHTTETFRLHIIIGTYLDIIDTTYWYWTSVRINHQCFL